MNRRDTILTFVGIVTILFRMTTSFNNTSSDNTPTTSLDGSSIWASSESTGKNSMTWSSSFNTTSTRQQIASGKEAIKREAKALAKKLYSLEGYEKDEVAAKLGTGELMGLAVASEYLKYFNFKDMPLLTSFRLFISKFSLAGESQVVARIVSRFAYHYHRANPREYDSKSSVEALILGLLLLNADLHGSGVGKKMLLSEFVHTMAGLVTLPHGMYEYYYYDIKNNPLKIPRKDHMSHVRRITSISLEPEISISIPDARDKIGIPADAPIFKVDQLMRKVEGVKFKKTKKSKRTWKSFQVFLKGFVLYFQQPHEFLLNAKDTSNAIVILNHYAVVAEDYAKRQNSLRLKSATGQSYLLMAKSHSEMMEWIKVINRAAALYTRLPMFSTSSGNMGAINFQNPIYSFQPTTWKPELLADTYHERIEVLLSELERFRELKPQDSGKKLNEWFSIYERLVAQLDQYQTYFSSILGKNVVGMPSGPEPLWDISKQHYKEFYRKSKRYRPHIEVWKSRCPVDKSIDSYQYMMEYPECPKLVVQHLMEPDMMEDAFY